MGMIPNSSNGFLAAQQAKIFDPVNPRIFTILGTNGNIFGLVAGENHEQAHIFSFSRNKWYPLNDFNINWEDETYDLDEIPDGGYKTQHEVYALAKEYGFKVNPLDITLETIIADIRGEINED